ncbi:MAG: DUF2628 domain-containing protein [Hyphomicrobiaceae bacterium]|nr:DUF2628 domain-containing protein [Hyphomicrobiaceae bacterium]
MKTYTVHEPPGPPADRADRAELLTFVKDGFDWSVFIFGPIALLAKQLYFATAAYVGALVGLVLLLAAIDADDAWISLALIALNTVFAFDANEFERRKLDRRGWTGHGSVTGHSRDECERRFLESWLPRQAMIRPNRAIERADVDGSGSQNSVESAQPRRGRLASLLDRLSGAKTAGLPGR